MTMLNMVAIVSNACAGPRWLQGRKCLQSALPLLTMWSQQGPLSLRANPHYGAQAPAMYSWWQWRGHILQSLATQKMNIYPINK
jgi:hypothetical protein